MARQIVLLRGINLVKRNRIAMPELRTALNAEGFGGVQTYVQSGNIVLSSPASPERVAEQVNATINKRFGFDIVAIARWPWRAIQPPGRINRLQPGGWRNW